MTTFYAHYDPDNGKIFSVAGRPIAEDHPGCVVVEVSEDIALKFLNHEWLMSDWVYGKQYGKEVELLALDAKGIVPINVGDFIEIQKLETSAPGLRVSLTLSENLIEFSIPNHFVGTRFDYIKDDIMTFTLTKRRDPSSIVAVFKVNVDDFFATGYASFKCDLNLNDYSIFTNRIFIYNIFEVNGLPKTVSRAQPESRYNKLVTFKEATIVDGVLATHDVKTNTLTLEIVGNPKLNWPMASTKCPIFLTKPKDPNVVYDVLPIDVESFWSNRKITLQLPKDLNQAFGVASYPLSSDLAFIRKQHGKRKKTTNRI
jgi:hypothetical protein